jgi:hypothetical protein
VFKIIQRARIRIGPTEKMLFVAGANRAEFGFLPARRNDDLVVVEERRTALSLRASLLAVSQYLLDCLCNRFLYPS